jgi:hypothetical protein
LVAASDLRGRDSWNGAAPADDVKFPISFNDVPCSDSIMVSLLML